MHSTDLPFKESSLHKQKRGLQGVNCFQWMETWICSSSWPSLPSSVSSFPHQIHLSFPLLRTRYTVGKRSTFLLLSSRYWVSRFLIFWVHNQMLQYWFPIFQSFSNSDFMPSKIKAFLLMQIVKNNTLLDLRKEQSLFFKLSANWHVIV